MIDYRKILLVYINHVGDREGMTFIGSGELPGLTAEEARELSDLDIESLTIPVEPLQPRPCYWHRKDPA